METDLIVDESAPNIYYEFGYKKDEGYSFNGVDVLYQGKENSNNKSLLNNPFLLLVTNCDMIGCHIPPSRSQVLLEIAGYGKIENISCFLETPPQIKILREVLQEDKVH